jgi:hypothetical protein
MAAHLMHNGVVAVLILLFEISYQFLGSLVGSCLL